MIYVIGAGMAGLLAAAMLRSECDSVIEKAPSLPNNHSAVLRFRTSLVGDALNIPFRKVRVVKATIPWRNPVADMIAYSMKTTGRITERSIADVPLWSERFIAPADLVSQMYKAAEPSKFTFNADAADFLGNVHSSPIISTIPMHTLMKMLHYPGHDSIEFIHRSGTNITFRLNDECDIYASLYAPDPLMLFSRISIEGNRVIVECPGVEKDSIHDPVYTVNEVMNKIGMCWGKTQRRVHSIEMNHQEYAKILPIPEDERKRFILWATEHHRVYSLGRYATWRPGLLLDDVVNDVRMIHRMIARGSVAPIYEARRNVS